MKKRSKKVAGGSEASIDGEDEEFDSVTFPVPSRFVWSKDYDIGFWRLEKLHPFDSHKWSKVAHSLSTTVPGLTFTPPRPAPDSVLLQVHTDSYLASLGSSRTVAMICEIPILSLLPNFIVRSKVLAPMRLQTGGSVVATRIAVVKGAAVNIGGGFHHCCSEGGGGFCVYADIQLAVRFARKRDPGLRVVIVDCDAHQGNGHETDFLGDRNTFIIDVYNAEIYPNDRGAKRAIAVAVELSCGTDSAQYLAALRGALARADSKMEHSRFEPGLVVYNAGTDILAGDPLGRMEVSPEAVVERDEIVFQWAREKGAACVMLTSGGYQMSNSAVIADSLRNLHGKGFFDERGE
jgi:histone deacetylase 11